jgi:hypothetical protein
MEDIMEREGLYAGELEEEALLALIQGETFLRAGLFLGECLPQETVKQEKRRDLLYFTRYDRYERDVPLTYYSTGRIFHRDFELRWEKRGQIWQVVYLGEAREFSQLHVVDDPFPWQTRREKQYYLFGTPLQRGQIPGLPDEENLFAEARIPRLLQYRPAPAGEEKKQRVCLVAYEYLNTVGRVQAFRFAGLERAE